MTDFHSHILPGVDDGSQSVEDSIQMLRLSWQQGITHIFLTPHFYPTQESPHSFWERRTRAVERLGERAVYEKEIPQYYIGSETAYFDGISQTEELDLLKVEKTNFLLLEMPFCDWSERVYHELWNLQHLRNITVVVAHIERYIKLQENNRFWELLSETGVLVQLNAEFLISRFTRRKAIEWIKKGRIDCLGSDCHDLQRRPPNVGTAIQILQSHCGLIDILKRNEMPPSTLEISK